MAFRASTERVQKNGSRGTMRRCRLLQPQIPTTITGHAVDRGQETDPHTRGRIRGVGVRSSLSLFTATTWGSRMCICSNPLSPIPVYIAISQGLTSNTALGWWYRPLWRGHVMIGTWAKRKWYILGMRRTQTKKQLYCHFLGNGIVFLSYQPFVIIHGIGGSSHLIQIWKSFTSNTLSGVMGYRWAITVSVYLRRC